MKLLVFSPDGDAMMKRFTEDLGDTQPHEATEECCDCTLQKCFEAAEQRLAGYPFDGVEVSIAFFLCLCLKEHRRISREDLWYDACCQLSGPMTRPLFERIVDKLITAKLITETRPFESGN